MVNRLHGVFCEEWETGLGRFSIISVAFGAQVLHLDIFHVSSNSGVIVVFCESSREETLGMLCLDW